MKAERVVGLVKRHPDGFGFLIPDQTEHPDLFLSRKEMTGVMTNDRVEAEVQKEKGGDRFYGINVSVVERGVSRVVGKVRKTSKGDLELLDGFQKWGAVLKIPFKSSRGAVDGDLVAVDIVDYPSKKGGFTGRVVEIIGDDSDPNNDLKRVLHLHQVPIDFPFNVLNETRVISQEVTDKDREGRKDLRDKALITIDGVTAKDFDDAIYVEKNSSGFRLWVAIADVSYYVTPGSSLDDSAFDRGTSVYLPNFVVPMLPEELSNGICSLKPEVDRLAFVCEMGIGYDGEVLDSQVYEAVICSHARVTYGEAQDIINGDETHKKPEVQENILLASDLAKILMGKRFREGSLDLEVPETEVVVDELGHSVDVIKSERVFAHRLIEEMMLIANVSVAKMINKKEQNALFRVHPAPESEDVDKIQQFLHSFGSTKKLRGGALQKKLTKSLQEFHGKPEGVVLNILTLRSMNQACYSVDNIGHFGLGFSDYAHFTSPIRRYPDLVVHRILKKLFTPSRAGFLYQEEDLRNFGTVLSASEQRAVKAERQVISIKKARFLSDKIGEIYPGIISSVTKFGVFVLLRQFDIDGLVKVDHLGDDHFEFDEEHLILFGKKTGKKFRLGDPVRVMVSAIDTEDGKIDFLLVKEGSDELVTNSKANRSHNKKRGKTKKIVTVFAKNGFQDVAQKIRLHSFISSWTSTKDVSHLNTAQRVRIAFEELGPTFIKLGQLLATRPDVIPREYIKEFRKLQDQIPPISFDEIEEILNSQFPTGYQKVFKEFSKECIGSASIAQVHRAVLHDGTPVVVKIQKPGVTEIIEDDIRILHLLADLCEDYIPESKIFNPSGMVNEFSRSISLETNFVVEANNIKRFQENFSDSEQVKIPNIYLNHSGRKVLVMEELKGKPMSHPEAFDQEGLDRDQLMKVGLRAYFTMVFKDGLFHGDLHAGNIFVLPDSKLGFIDFGMVGRISRKTQSSIATMFMALLSEDYDRLAYEYIELAPFNSKTERGALAQDLRSILSPFFGLSLKNVNMGKLLLESSRVAAKHHVVLPSELMMFFKSMVTIEGLARMVREDFDMLPFVQEFSKDLLKSKISTTELFSDVGFQMKEWTSLLDSLPKEMKTHLRKINQPDYAQTVQVKNIKDLQNTVYQSFRLVFIGLVISALTIAGAMTIDHQSSNMVYGLPVVSLSMFILAGLLFVRFFLKNK